MTKYQDIFYIEHVDGELSSLEVQMNTAVQVAQSFNSFQRNSSNLARRWDSIIPSASNWLKVVKRDWIKANKQVWLSYPLNRRYGIVCSSLVRESLKLNKS